jgi:hypothetical protein
LCFPRTNIDHVHEVALQEIGRSGRRDTNCMQSPSRTSQLISFGTTGPTAPAKSSLAAWSIISAAINIEILLCHESRPLIDITGHLEATPTAHAARKTDGSPAGTPTGHRSARLHKQRRRLPSYFPQPVYHSPCQIVTAPRGNDPLYALSLPFSFSSVVTPIFLSDIPLTLRVLSFQVSLVVDGQRHLA